MRWLVGAVVAVTAVVLLIVVVPVIAIVTLLGDNCGSGTPTANVTAPGGSPATEAQFVRYFESQHIPADAAAGIVGNLEQENTLNPIGTFGAEGMAQWNESWWSVVSGWTGAHGQAPGSAAGQLMYLAAVVTTGVSGDQAPAGDSKLHADMYAATSPQDAALYWQNDYEQCRGAGAPGTLGGTDGPDTCESSNRENYAAQALQAAGGASSSGLTVLVSAEPGAQLAGSCNASYPVTGTGSIAGYTNPFEKATGISWERTDQGVDAAMNPGSPILAFAPSKVVMIIDFYAGEPAIVMRITAGPFAGKWWYMSEQIQPTVSTGQTVDAGQTIATYAPSGTGIETGWWDPNGGVTLAMATTGYTEGDPTISGADFRYLLQKLGANPGSGAGMSSGTTIGTSFYPTGNPGP